MSPGPSQRDSGNNCLDALSPRNFEAVRRVIQFVQVEDTREREKSEVFIFRPENRFNCVTAVSRWAECSNTLQPEPGPV